MSVEQMAFEWSKKIVGQEPLLAYPDFNTPFKVHTDASDTQLGAVISQHGIPTTFYLRKLNIAQNNYMNTEQEHFNGPFWPYWLL
eukprot:8965453-Ditylum_brightwellii.AAC.1